jgi:site-specific recombinase XerD
VQWPRSKERKALISDLPKNGKYRTVFLTTDAANALKKLKHAMKRESGLVFSQDGQTLISYRAIQYRYNKAFQRAGLKWQSTHIMRHTFATDFLRRVGDALPLQGQLGHSKLSQTQHYAKLVQETVKKGVNSYDLSLQDNNVIPFPPPKASAGNGW